MELKEKLVALRKEKGLTQSAVAEKLDVSRQAKVRYTCVMRGLAVVTFVNWKAHHGPGISNPFERAGK